MLPSPIRSAFAANGEILEALVPDFSLEPFLSLVPEGVEQIVVQSQSPSPNLDLWLLQQSHIIKSMLGSDVPDMPELRDFGFSRQLGLKHGGSLFLAKRKARPEVLVAYRLSIIYGSMFIMYLHPTGWFYKSWRNASGTCESR